MILFCDMYSPWLALFPMCYLMRLWCICDVLFDAHQMFIFPSPDGGTWLFLRELLGDRGGGGASMFHKVLKKQTGCALSMTWVFLSWDCDFEVWKAQSHCVPHCPHLAAAIFKVFCTLLPSNNCYLKIPSEMEVAPHYNCWHCWHCSTLLTWRIMSSHFIHICLVPIGKTSWGLKCPLESDCHTDV